MHSFSTRVIIGRQLKNLAAPAEKYRRRECFPILRDFVFGGHQDRVFALCGLRWTGKTTMIRQVILDMTPEQLSAAAFLQITEKDTLRGVNADLKYLQARGFRYVFLDEVTLLEDFIEDAA